LNIKQRQKIRKF